MSLANERQNALLSRLLYSGFWEGKVPCWEMLRCPQAIRDLCPASKHPEYPCWEIEGTYAKLARRGEAVVGCDTAVCSVCRVYRRWGENRAVTIRLFGEGINSCPGAQEKLKESMEDLRPWQTQR